jgi:catechol O-methyltransferase
MEYANKIKFAFNLFVREPVVRIVTGETKEERVIQSVFAKAQEGSPDSVLAVMDDIGWHESFLMNVGDTKGVILDQCIQDVLNTKKPQEAKAGFVFVEFGGYLGYSAVRIGRQLKTSTPKGKLYSIEKNPLFAAISTKIVEFAGLRENVQVIVGTVEEKLPELKTKHGIKAVDFVFIDHWKDMYLPDVKRLEQSGLLRPGSVVVADNVLFPGCPEYQDYMMKNTKFDSKFIKSKLEYNNEIEDGLLVSVLRATSS